MRIVVLGAGISGLVAGLLLARDGHDVTLLERDPGAVPEGRDAAWEDWSRDGVAQFRQAHYLCPAAAPFFEPELPDVVDALAAAGALPLRRARASCRRRSPTATRGPATSAS